MRLAQTARNDLAYDRMHLAVVPLPARFGSRTELRESQEWLGRFAEVLGEFYKDWLPSWLDPRLVVESSRSPKSTFSVSARNWLSWNRASAILMAWDCCDRVASLLSNNLQDAETVLKIERSEERKVESHHTKSSVDYEYDVYVSYRHQAVMNEWLRAFVSELQAWVGLETGYEPKIFLDYSELTPEIAGWSKRLDPSSNEAFAASSYAGVLRLIVVCEGMGHVPTKRTDYPCQISIDAPHSYRRKREDARVGCLPDNSSI